MIPLSSETRVRLEALFPKGEQDAAAKLLMEKCGDGLPLTEWAKEDFWDRIRFAVLKLSSGDLKKLKQEVEGANCDWRDTLMAAGFDVIASKKKERIRISISSPYPKETGEWACLFELSGAKQEEEKHEYFGVDGLQALILSLFYLRSVLARLRKKGYAFHAIESGEQIHPEAFFDVFSKPA